MAPCDPNLCVDHKAHQLALAEGNKKFDDITKKLDILLEWRTEVKTAGIVVVAVVAFVSSIMGIVGGGLAVYKGIHSTPPVITMTEGIAIK